MKDMSASEGETGRLVFWNRIFRHQRSEAEDDDAGRPPLDEAEELRLAWSRYCEVIAELEQGER
jgi:hypothetical protein